MDRERLAEMDSERSRRRLLLISFPGSFDAKILSVCNETHYELTFLSRVLSTLIASLWINTLILVYLILV